MRNSVKISCFKLPPGGFTIYALVLCLGALTLSAQTNFFWTGGGSDDLWSNPANWGEETLFPSTTSDIANFGSAAPNAAQNVVVDGEYSVQRLNFSQDPAQPLQQFTFVPGGNGTLSIGGNTVGIAVESSVLNDVTFDVPINITHNTTWYPHNNSAKKLIFNGNFSSPQSIFIQFGQQEFNGALQITNRQIFIDARSASSPSVITLRSTDFSVNSLYFQTNNSGTGSAAEMRFGVDTAFNHQLFIGGSYAGPGYFQLIEGGTDDRIVTFGRAMHSLSDTGVLSFLENETGSTGRFILRSTASGSNGTHFMPIVTQENTYIRFDSTGTALLSYGANSQRATRISGAGHLWKSNSGTLEVQTENTYTGRTMISGGTLRLGSHTIGDDTFHGQLPSGTIVELGSGATFDLNGINQTIGGLSGWRGLDQDQGETFGTVQLSGATLTINASEASSFDLSSGSIAGTGALVKSGSATFTLSGDYDSAAGRTLRLEGGLLEVGTTLLIDEASTFELAGGRLAATNLLAENTQWDISLLLANVDQTLVNIAAFADITGAQLNLELGAGYSPSFGQTFTLLSADFIDGASEGGSLFQYTDGETFLISGIEFQIDWVSGSENIVLTVIPEPRAWASLGLLALGMLLWKRRRSQ